MSLTRDFAKLANVDSSRAAAVCHSLKKGGMHLLFFGTLPEKERGCWKEKCHLSWKEVV